VKRSYNRDAPERGPLPAPSVYLVCTRSGRWVGDVIEAPSTAGLWPDGRRFHVMLVDCKHHKHIPPSDAEVAAAWGEAERNNASVPMRVDEAC
jgi:hypothetical protein